MRAFSSFSHSARWAGKTSLANTKVFTEAKQQDANLDVAEVKSNQANADLQAGDAQKAVDLYREALAGDPKMLALIMTSLWPWTGLATTPESGWRCRTP